MRSLSSLQPYKRAYVVTGCDRHAVLVLVSGSDGKLRDIPGGQSAWVTYYRAFDLGAVVDPPPAPIDRAAFTSELKEWVNLVRQAAKDLKCGATDILPDFVPQGDAPTIPIGEGCGKRATYVEDSPGSFRLLSIVNVE